MGKENYTSRILLKKNNIVRSFYWVSIGTDKSIYFGSSITDKFTYGYSETTLIGPEGQNINPMKTGKLQNSKELKGKYSLHTSGLALLPTRETNLRKEYKIKSPYDSELVIPLVGILPMFIEKYTIFPKKIKEKDIVINTDVFEGFPFGVLIYTHPPGKVDFKVITKLPQSYPIFYSNTSSISYDREITVITYSDKMKFTFWRNEEYIISARPDEKNLDYFWPFFGST